MRRKSQLAIEYVYYIRDLSPDRWVLWIHASNAARFEQSYRDVADYLKIAGQKNPQINTFKTVHDWLCDKKNGTWLLVLDNVDDAAFLFETNSLNQASQPDGDSGRHSQPLVAYLPQSPNGSILITTRTRTVALKLVEKSNIIMVDPMNEAQAMALLRKKPETREDDQEVAELAAAFEFMPLAIVQAATYIYQRAPRCSVRQYLEKFKRSDREKMTLLDEEGGHLRRHWEAKNSILITWQISFNHIQHTRPTAANLLSLVSFLDRQGIPESLLRHRYATYDAHENVDNVSGGGAEDDQKCDDDDSSELGNSNEFEEDVLMLRNCSFIVVNMDTTAFEMHGLVQLATRKWLNANGQLDRWKEQFIEKLCAEFPRGEYENWAKCQALFPHVKSAVSQQPRQDDSLRKWAFLLFRAASYAWRRGNVTDTETMSMKAMKRRQKLFGREHEETLRSMAMTA